MRLLDYLLVAMDVGQMLVRTTAWSKVREEHWFVTGIARARSARKGESQRPFLDCEKYVDRRSVNGDEDRLGGNVMSLGIVYFLRP